MLHITGRRDDGYHLLQTVFQFIDYADQIGLALRTDGRILHHNPVDPDCPGNDLASQAAALFARLHPDFPGVDIHVNKRIPMGGGLGGGSSDAATVLVALNRLCDTGFGQQVLASEGLALGADVPVFVNARACWAEGVGEQITPLQLPEPWYLVLVPGCHVATAAVFSQSDLTRDSTLTTIADFLGGGGRNDCEQVVRRLYPPVNSAMTWLEQYATARLTGTGACVFAAFPGREQAQEVLQAVPQEYHGFVARGLNRSPLADSIGND